MKIAITGHTDGIGKRLYDTLIKKYEVVGYSRSNGFDIKNYDKIIKEIDDCDVFINNAFEKQYQTKLFELVFNMWKLLPKTIINMNSSCVYETSDWNPEYADNKKIFKDVSMNIIRSNTDKKVRVTNLYPATLSSHDGFNRLNKIDINYLSDLICWLIEQPKEIEIREMSIYCTTLKKEYKIDKLL